MLISMEDWIIDLTDFKSSDVNDLQSEHQACSRKV